MKNKMKEMAVKLEQSEYETNLLSNANNKLKSKLKALETELNENKMEPLCNVTISDNADEERQQMKMKMNNADEALLRKSLREENALLRELNAEMKDKNMLLIEKNERLTDEIQNAKINTTRTFANVLETNNTTRTKQRIPAIIVKPKHTQEAMQTKRDLLNVVKLKDTNVGINRLSLTSRGEVKIKCANTDDANLVTSEIKKCMGNNYDIQQEQLWMPRLKIVGIEEKYSPDELYDEIIKRNLLNTEIHSIKVNHIMHISAKDTYTAFAEVNPQVYQLIMKGTKKLYIGWQSCLVFDDFNIKRCQRCCGYGHSAKKCNKPYYCANCAGEHDTGDCTNAPAIRCINCITANSRFKLERETNHRASDEVACKTFQDRKKYIIGKTDYPIGIKIM